MHIRASVNLKVFLETPCLRDGCAGLLRLPWLLASHTCPFDLECLPPSARGNDIILNSRLKQDVKCQGIAWRVRAQLFSVRGQVHLIWALGLIAMESKRQHHPLLGLLLPDHSDSKSIPRLWGIQTLSHRFSHPEQCGTPFISVKCFPRQVHF